eukprot:COSAG04_NODE_16870_length_486_cov_1.191214_2_plen_39_part_01
MCDGTWFVAVGGGNIFGARSVTQVIPPIGAEGLNRRPPR